MNLEIRNNIIVGLFLVAVILIWLGFFGTGSPFKEQVNERELVFIAGQNCAPEACEAYGERLKSIAERGNFNYREVSYRGPMESSAVFVMTGKEMSDVLEIESILDIELFECKLKGGCEDE